MTLYLDQYEIDLFSQELFLCYKNIWVSWIKTFVITNEKFSHLKYANGTSYILPLLLHRRRNFKNCHILKFQAPFSQWNFLSQLLCDTIINWAYAQVCIWLFWICNRVIDINKNSICADDDNMDRTR